MHHAGRHDVGPAVGHRQRPAAQIVVQAAREGLHMRIDAPAQPVEQRRDEMQPVERAIGGVAAEIVLGRPALARRIGGRQRLAFVGQVLVEARASPADERLVVDQCRKQGPDRHSVIIGEARASCYGFACLPTQQIEDLSARRLPGHPAPDRGRTARRAARAHRPHRGRGARRHGQRRALRPRAQPQRHPAPRAPAEARDLQALRVLPRSRARSEDHRDPAAAARTRRSASMAASST